MTRPTERKLERQAATVSRLAAELRFELLLLRRMRAAAQEGARPADPQPTLGEIHAAAVLREAAACITP